ncbi:hypothetical protein Ahy_Scaffold1g107338 isoform C [Arachis hypogaea]|uniref:Uncharacterized protein n=1 Tax=Arachis hypogaea TaxID=3818 RepID=A0A444WVI0_ARAHY|nr:hypothetical protein Ahy_Scaffold1g107338 isoform C [Arachis hypogaea]
MDFFLNGMNGIGDESECPFDAMDMQRCPFLRNINKPTNFSFSSAYMSVPVHGRKGPIFEDGPSFDMAFKLFHGKDGVVPLFERSDFNNGCREADSMPVFNPLAGRAATISLSAFGPGGLFNFGNLSDKWKKQKSESSKKKEHSSLEGDASKHEALGNEWLANGNCPIAKSYRAVSNVLPLVATAFRPPPGIKIRCPPAVVAARAALARTAFVKNLRPQPLPAKMLCIAAMGMALNVPLGMWKEHTKKFSLSWFAAVHAAVPFIAMLRKSVVMPKSAMALTIAASILGQVIGSRAERIRLKAAAVAETGKVAAETASSVANYNPMQIGDIRVGCCGPEGMHSAATGERIQSQKIKSNDAEFCVHTSHYNMIEEEQESKSIALPSISFSLVHAPFLLFSILTHVRQNTPLKVRIFAFVNDFNITVTFYYDKILIYFTSLRIGSFQGTNDNESGDRNEGRVRSDDDENENGARKDSD